MAIAPPRDLKIGTIVDKTFGVMEHGLAAVAIYVVALTVINGALTYFALTMTAPMQLLGFQLANLAVGIVGAYFLIEALVRKTGLRSRTDDEAFLPFLGLYVLYSLGFLLGLILLVLPALFVTARWSIAFPLLLARGDRPTKALGESWERTRGNEFPILVSMLALAVVPIAVIIACRVLFGQENLFGLVVGQLATSAISATLLAMGVALYGLIIGAPAASSPAE